MAIDIAEVDRIARLARLKLDGSDKQKMQQELSAILDYVDQLQEVQEKTEIKPYEDESAVNLMRDDVAESSTPPEELLKLAPSREGDFVKVKSVLE